MEGEQGGFDARFIELAGDVNGHMPQYVVAKVADALNGSRKAVNGARILILGVAYKRDIDDVRESPALDVMKLLREKGAHIAYSDPHVPFLSRAAWHGPHALESLELDPSVLEQFDCAVIVTPNLVDTRNALHGRAGVGARRVIRIGASADWQPRPAFAA